MINLTFETLEEMVEFAKRVVVLGDRGCPNIAATTTVTTPLPMPAQAALVQNVPLPMAPQTPPAQEPPVQQPPVQPPVQQLVQTTTQEYVLDDIAKAAMTLMDKGMQGQLQELLNGYGVASLPELPKEQYGNFATALRGMGAQI